MFFNWLQQLGNSTEFEEIEFLRFDKYLLQVNAPTSSKWAPLDGQLSTLRETLVEFWIDHFQQEVYECKNLTVCANQNDQTHIACFIPRQAEKNVRNDLCDLDLTPLNINFTRFDLIATLVSGNIQFDHEFDFDNAPDDWFGTFNGSEISKIQMEEGSKWKTYPWQWVGCDWSNFGTTCNDRKMFFLTIFMPISRFL